MRKTFAAALSIIWIFTAGSVAGETWKITSLDWEPYSGANLAAQGSAIQKLRAILEKEEIRLVVEFYPWKRAQAKAREKAYVGYFPAWPEEVYEGFTASPVIDWSEVAILKRAGTRVSFETIDDLFEKYTVGVVKTYAYPKVIADAMRKHPNHTDEAPNEVSLLKKLSIGRHAVAITEPSVMMYLARENGIDNVETIKIIMKKGLVIALRDDEDNRKRIRLLKTLLNDR